MQDSLPKVYIIILNYQSWQDTIECLESLLKLEYQNKQVVVIDNDSPNNSYEHLVDWAKHNLTSYATLPAQEVGTNLATQKDLENDFIFIKSKENRGFAAGNNIGLSFALKKNDLAYAWLLNNDTVVDPLSLTSLVQQAEEDKRNNKKKGIWGSKLLFFDTPNIIQAVGGKFNKVTFTTTHLQEGEEDSPQVDQLSVQPDYVVGASLFVSLPFLKTVGLLNEDYFLYFEELDWAERAKRNGFTLGYAPLSRVYHKEGKTIGSSSSGKSKSLLADHHGARSKMIFIKKFYPKRTVQLYLVMFASAALKVFRRQPDRAAFILKLMLNRNAL